MLWCGIGRTRLDEPFLFFRTNSNDDFVRRKGRESVADGETDVRLPGNSIDGLAGKLLGRAFSDSLRMTERFLVVGEPVEHALPYDRHHDLDRVGLPNMCTQYVICLFDGADNEDALAHNGNVPPGPCRLRDLGERCLSYFRSGTRPKAGGGFNTPETAASHPLSAPSASARNDVDQRNESDNDHYGDGDDCDRGRGNDHALCYPVLSS
jgi:hypothetical protein